jgi:hypothetical protein
MATKGYDVFYTETDACEEMHCKVCNTLCLVERSMTGPTGWAEAVAGRGHWHDVFRCPNSRKDWHEQALRLIIEIEETPSKRLAEQMLQDLRDLLLEHGCPEADDNGYDV